MIDALGLTDPGPVRKTNEDCFFCDASLGLFIVADGLGGHAAGEVASSLAVETISGFIRRIEDDGEFSWPYGFDAGLSFGGNLLRTAVQLANRRVFRAAERNDEYTGMGTTVVAGLVSGSRLAVANAGDSRLYLFHDGQLTQLTHDDTWAATLLAAQAGEPAGTPPGRSTRHVLTNVVGASEQTEVHVTEQDLVPGDLIFLCSDGLHGVIDDETLTAMLAGSAAPADIAPALIKAAIDLGVRDNITAVLARYDGA